MNNQSLPLEGSLNGALHERPAKVRRLIGHVVAKVQKRRAAVVAVAAMGGQRSGPQGPKVDLDAPPFDWPAHVRKLKPRGFRRRYRMDEPSFNELVTLCGPHLPDLNLVQALRSRRGAGAVSHAVTMAITLSYLAGSRMDDLWLVYSPISRSRLYPALWHGVYAINNALRIDYPYDDVEKMRDLEMDFRAHTRQQEVVGLVGCTDGAIIATRNPGRSVDNPEAHHCSRKDTYAILLMATCDYFRKFTAWSINAVGKMHDSPTFKASRLGTAVYSDNIPHPFVLFGDSAFANNNTMITPCGRQRDTDFDFFQSSYRMPIECAFGILCRRWAVLARPLEVSHVRRTPLIAACLTLHNFCIDKSQAKPEDFLDRHHDKVQVQPGEWLEISAREKVAYTREGAAVLRLGADGHEHAPVLLPGGSTKARRDQLRQQIRERGMKRPHADL